MPRKKKVKSEDIKGFQEEEETLIAHLPIKVNKKENKECKEIEKLQKENKELKEKINLLLIKNNNKVSVIKNNCSGDKIKCWWCDDNKSTICLPNKKTGKKFEGIGKFCSFSCALAYNFELRDEKVWERCSLLYQMKNNIDEKKIEPSPPKEIMKEFGGEISREEYRNIIDNGESSYLKLLPPMISSVIMIEQRNNSTKQINQLNLLGIKLKRTKNPVKNKFSLDSLISS